jgi:predicted DNA-binding protein (MmcQ/YjbR family)
MDREAIRTFCLSFPGVSEQLQWGADLLYKIGGKMFVCTNMGPDPISLSLKAHPEKFDELCGRAGVGPAPYLARAKWVRVEPDNDLSSTELHALITESFELVNAKLPKSKRAGVSAAASKTKRKHAARAQSKSNAKTKTKAKSAGAKAMARRRTARTKKR